MFKGKGKPTILILIAAATTVIVVSGCGNSSSPNLQTGEQLFKQSCGSCHTLAEAGTEANIGPNLDDAFADSIVSGLKRSTIESVVRAQIKFPQGDEMPANLVTGQDVDDVASYVADVAAPNVKAKN